MLQVIRILCYAMVTLTLIYLSKPCDAVLIPPPPKNFTFARLDEGIAKVWGANNCTAYYYPFMVGIVRFPEKQKYLNYTCGGTLIHPRVVLTTASCIEDEVGLKIAVGLYLSKPVVIDVARIRLHPGWLDQKKKIKDNIGVVILKEDVRGLKVLRLPKRHFRGELRPSCLNGIIISMGEKSPGETPDVYKDGYSCGEMRLIDQDDCYEAYPTLGKDFFNTVICTYNENNAMGVFRSDAGSPLICGHYQIGIVSFSIRYKIPLPNVFTRVDYYVQWIRNKIPRQLRPPSVVRDQDDEKDDAVEEINFQKPEPRLEDTIAGAILPKGGFPAEYGSPIGDGAHVEVGAPGAEGDEEEYSLS